MAMPNIITPPGGPSRLSPRTMFALLPYAPSVGAPWRARSRCSWAALISLTSLREDFFSLTFGGLSGRSITGVFSFSFVLPLVDDRNRDIGQEGRGQEVQWGPWQQSN